ncbi:MAG: methionyl-tRNA formyltransferase [Bacteroidaceae bacterium]|nr:methionyl-tRNA formyltransferase [Bacteroidaceae bacterium]
MNKHTSSQIHLTPLPAREGQGGGSASLRIVFMGTPDFAVASLRKLVENHCNVVAVVTMPDKPVGRHHDTLQASPVKQYAVSQGIPVLQPERLKDEAFLEELRSYRADLQVVVAFRMLPEVVWAMPPLGTFNLHAALLPQYRGAAPINWAVINGETETGITTFFLDHDIDTGRIIHRVPSPIADTDTVGDVHDRLMELGADLVLRTVKDIAAGTANPVDQDTVLGGSPAESLNPAPKLTRDNTQIRWHEHTVKSAYDFIRGLSPYPGAWTTLCTADGKETQLKVFGSLTTAPSPDGEGSRYSQGQEANNEQTAQVITPLAIQRGVGGEASLLVPLRDGDLRLTDLQLAGKRRMPVQEFLRGAHLEGAILKEC